MSDICSGAPDSRPVCGNAGAFRAAEWLSLAAAPTFATMALLTGFSGEGAPAIICSAAHDASPLNGMALMYLLMSAFHLMPWLKLIAASRKQGDVSASASRKQAGCLRMRRNRIPAASTRH
jgi:hypothetical protein